MGKHLLRELLANNVTSRVVFVARFNPNGNKIGFARVKCALKVAEKVFQAFPQNPYTGTTQTLKISQQLPKQQVKTTTTVPRSQNFRGGISARGTNRNIYTPLDKASIERR